MPGDQDHPKVLVVDDQQDLRETTAAILRSEGYVVVKAADGIEAMERLRWSEIDIMLLDLGLPRMDGPTLLENLEEPPAVVVLSAFGEWSETEIRSRFTPTVVACLQKPVSPVRLLAATAAAARDRARAN
jgi:two-component system response regulator VanR